MAEHNTQDTIFGGFAPNSSSAETLSKALGSRTVMSGSVSRSKNDPSQSLQTMNTLTPYPTKATVRSGMPNKKEIQDGILEKYPPEWKEETPAPSDAGGGQSGTAGQPKERAAENTAQERKARPQPHPYLSGRKKKLLPT